MSFALPTRPASIGPITEPVIVGSSPALRRALRIAERLASGDSKVLITGESGVGKDVVARFVHVQLAARRPARSSR